MSESLEKVTAITERCAVKLGVFVQGLLSESDGTPSSTRVLLFVFATFSVCALSAIVHHMIRLTDIGLLGAWLAAFPVIVGVFSGLIVLPYTINRGFNTLPGAVSDIFKSKAAMNISASLLNPTPPAPAPEDHHEDKDAGITVLETSTKIHG
jgi:hypothetical protein